MSIWVLWSCLRCVIGVRAWGGSDSLLVDLVLLEVRREPALDGVAPVPELGAGVHIALNVV